MTTQEKADAYDALVVDATAAGLDVDDLVTDASIYMACEAKILANQPEAAVGLMGGDRFLRWK